MKAKVDHDTVQPPKEDKKGYAAAWEHPTIEPVGRVARIKAATLTPSQKTDQTL